MNKDLSIELLRIISMSLVVIGHILGGYIPTIGESVIGGDNQLIFTVIPKLSFFIPFHINIFILISGYCGIKGAKQSLIKNYILLFSTLLIIYIFSLATNQNDKFQLTSLLLPLSHNPWWYMRIYIAACLIIPFLNPIIQNISIKDFRNLIIGALIIDVYLGFYCRIETLHHDGYDLIHFLTIYMVGAYINKSKLKERLNLHFGLRFKHLFIIFIITAGIKLCYYVIVTAIGAKDYFMDYNQPFNILLAIILFLSILNLNIKSSKILFFSTSMVTVYLIHTHPLIEHLIRDSINFFLDTTNYNFIAGCCIIIAIFTIIIITGVFIDKIRIVLFSWMTPAIETSILCIENYALRMKKLILHDQ